MSYRAPRFGGAGVQLDGVALTLKHKIVNRIFAVPPRVRWFLFLALVALVIYVLSQPATSPVIPSPIQSVLAPTSTAVELSVYSEAIAGSPRAINPLQSDFNDADQDLVALLFNGLTSNSASGESRPALAQSWEISEDGLIYTFALRHDVKWHDGTPFTSRDISATLALLQSPDFSGSPALADFWRKVAVQVSGDYTVTFLLSEPFAPFLSYTSLGILPAHIVEQIPPNQWPDRDFNVHPIGTGPFRLTKIDAGRAIVTLEPFADYFGAKAKLGRIELHFYPTALAAVAAYQRGEVLGVAHVPAEKLSSVRRMESTSMYAAPISGFNVLYMNLKNPLFQQKEVRQALLLALDRQQLIDRALDGQGIVAHSPLLPENWAYNRFVKKYMPDASAARSLLEQAGWRDGNGDGIVEKNGVKLEFAIMSTDEPAQIRMIENITMQWEAIGVKAHTQAVGFSGLARDFLRPRRFDTVYVEWRDPTSDPDLYPLWHSTRVNDEGQNYASWINRDADEILEEARRTSDPTRRLELYTRFQELFADQVPALLISYPVYVYAVDRRVQNVQLGTLTRPSDRFRTIADWVIDSKQAVLSAATPVPTPTINR